MIFLSFCVQGSSYEKRIEKLTLSQPAGGADVKAVDPGAKVRELIARRAAQELQGIQAWVVLVLRLI